MVPQFNPNCLSQACTLQNMPEWPAAAIGELCKICLNGLLQQLENCEDEGIKEHVLLVSNIWRRGFVGK